MNFKYNSSYMREQSGRTEAGNDRETGSVSQKCFRGAENPMSLYELIFAWIIIWTRFRPFLLGQFSRIKRKRCSTRRETVVREKRSVLLIWIERCLDNIPFEGVSWNWLIWHFVFENSKSIPYLNFVFYPLIDRWITIEMIRN